MKKKSFGFAAVMSLALFAALSLNGCESSKKEESLRDTLPSEGQPAIALAARTLDGKEISLEKLKGRPVVINFWASWCGPCRAEAPAFEKVYQAFGESGVTFIGVAVQDSPEGASKFVKEFKITYPVVLDESGDLARAYKIFGVPKTFIVGKDGRFSFIFTGAVPEEDLAREIKKAL